MKVCPKCSSSFSDETLNFCLTDGIPLIDEDLFDGTVSNEFDWQKAETIFDADLKIHQANSNATSPNSASDTAPKLKINTASFSTQPPAKTRPYLIPLLGVLAMVSVAGGIFWWLYVNDHSAFDAASKKVSIDSQGSNKQRKVVSLTKEQENSIKKEVSELLEAWRKSIEKRDADANVKFYANTLATYYKESGIDRNHVRADRQRAIDRYESLALEIDNLNITPESTELATAIFDKSWTFKNPVKISTGSVQQEMNFIKLNGKWLIDGEKDVKVYYLNNRETSAANTNSNQTEGNENVEKNANTNQ